jgi:hypothetical protein
MYSFLTKKYIIIAIIFKFNFITNLVAEFSVDINIKFMIHLYVLMAEFI